MDRGREGESETAYTRDCTYEKQLSKPFSVTLSLLTGDLIDHAVTRTLANTHKLRPSSTK